MSVTPSEQHIGKLSSCLVLSVVLIWEARETILREHFISQLVIDLLSEQQSCSVGCVKPKAFACPGIIAVIKLEIQPIFPSEKSFFSPAGKKQDKVSPLKPHRIKTQLLLGCSK